MTELNVVAIPHGPMDTLNLAVLCEGGEKDGELNCGESLRFFKGGLAEREFFMDPSLGPSTCREVLNW